MIFQHDVRVPHRGGQWLSANIYRPADSDGNPVPVISSLGPYNKERHTTESDPFESRLLSRQQSTVVYERFEGERWVEFGYAVVHLDTPGCGLSPGTIDVFSMRDLEYYYDAIEWIAKQPWCDGNVASCGLSYHSYTSVGVATLNPPSLKAIIPWEVGADAYHDLCYPGGIRNNNFFDWWFNSWVLGAQTARALRTDSDLANDQVGLIALSKAHPHYDSFWRGRTPDIGKIRVPFYTVANVCGHPISTNYHFRMLRETQTPHDKQWLEIITGKHVKPMYDDENVLSQRRFLDHILKGKPNGWDKVPRVKYTTRGRFDYKSFLYDSQWPPVRTLPTEVALDASRLAQKQSSFSTLALAGKPHHSLTVCDPATLPSGLVKFHNNTDEAMFEPAFPYAGYIKNLRKETQRPGSSVSFLMAPFDEHRLVAGQSIVKLYVSLEGFTDADIFVTLRYIAKDDHEVVFDGILDSPNLPVAFGYQRVSKRKIDPKISCADYVFLDGSIVQPVENNEVIELSIMLGPVSVIVEKGGRLLLEVSSRNSENSYCYIQSDPEDRKMGGEITVHTGGKYPSGLRLPFQPNAILGLPESI